MNKKTETIKDGLAEALPLASAIATYGLSYGILAVQAKLGAVGAVVMSLMVFSGSVQMVTVSMLMSGAGPANIIATSVLLNIRNLLYGAALAEGLSSSGRWKWLLCFGVSDEPFVLGSSRFKKYGPDPLYFGVITGTFYVAWVLSSLIGALVGDRIDPKRWGLDLAFPVTLMALLIPGLMEKPAMATAIFAAVLTIAMGYIMPGSQSTIIIVGVLSPLLGVYLARRGRNGQ